MKRPPPRSTRTDTLFPYTTLFRSGERRAVPAAPGLGIGLANTRERLETMYGSGAALITTPLTDGFRSEIRLPVKFALHDTRERSEERRAGKECFSACNSWLSPYHTKHNHHKHTTL